MLREQVTGATTTTANSSRTSISDIFVAARPRQWIKNGFVFAALIFAAKITHPGLVLRVMGAFLLFCLLSSSTYLLNDVVDLEADRQHPLKSQRPIAAGRVPTRLALALSVIFMVVGLGLGFLLDLRFGLIASAFLATSIAYSFYLKHLVLIDVFAIAGCFVLRAAGGAAAIHVHISPWLYLCTILLALLLGFGKRRHELILLEDTAHVHRRNLGEYTGPLLDDLINIVAGATIIAFSLYTFFADAVPHNHAMMVTIPFVLYGVFRYLLLIHSSDMSGAPEEVVWKDRPLLADLVAWVITSGIILYVFK